MWIKQINLASYSCMHYNSSGVASKLIASTPALEYSQCSTLAMYSRAGTSFMRVTRDFIASVRDVICERYCSSFVLESLSKDGLR